MTRDTIWSRVAITVAGVAIVMTLAPLAAGAADVGNGETLAKRWCAACHIVASDQSRGNAQVPPFSAIAKKPGFNAGTVALFLLAPHPMMPSMSLSRAEAADIAAYIAMQK